MFENLITSIENGIKLVDGLYHIKNCLSLINNYLWVSTEYKLLCYNTDSEVIVPFNYIGNIDAIKDRINVITKFYDAIKEDRSPIIFGDGSQIRDFISVEDVAKANLLSMQSNTDFAFLNIGTGTKTSIRELAYLMIKLSGKSLTTEFDKLPEGDIIKSQAGVSLAQEVINWSYETHLEDGLRDFFFT